MKLSVMIASSALLFGMGAVGCGPSSGSGTCTVDNCGGCCLNGACQTGTAVSACGRNAATCAVCGTGQTCNSSQVCAFDGASMWRVRPVSATVKNNNNGAKWDADDSAADPFVELYCPANANDKTATTGTVSDSYSPTWSGDGCLVSASTLISGGFAYQVSDSDVIGSEPITAKISVTVTEANLLAGSAAVTPTDGLMALSIALQKQ